MPAAPAAPERSPIQVQSGLNVAKLHCSLSKRCIEHGRASGMKKLHPNHCSPSQCVEVLSTLTQCEKICEKNTQLFFVTRIW